MKFPEQLNVNAAVAGIAVVSMLLGGLVTLVFNDPLGVEKMKATNDCREIATAVVLYKTDTGLRPGRGRMLYTDGLPAENERSLTAPGSHGSVDPAEAERIETLRALARYQRSAQGTVENRQSTMAFCSSGASVGTVDERPREKESGKHISMPLVENRPPAVGWNGPYAAAFPPDPWGSRYVIVFEDPAPGVETAGWVLSPGPDRRFDTSPDDSALRGDDIGLPLE